MIGQPHSRRRPLARPVPVRLVLTRRALEDPIHGQCGACREQQRLQQLVILGADELAVCHGCYDAAARFGRLGDGHPILFALEHLRPVLPYTRASGGRAPLIFLRCRDVTEQSGEMIVPGRDLTAQRSDLSGPKE